MAPFCLVLMPDAVMSPTHLDRLVDFPAVRSRLIGAALNELGITEVFADALSATIGGSSAHRERLRWCEVAVVDVSMLTTDVSFELGFRDAAKPGTTIRIAAASAADTSRQPDADVLNYDVDDAGVAAHPTRFIAALVDRLAVAHVRIEARLTDFIGDWTGLSHAKTDVFRDNVARDAHLSAALAEARRHNDVEQIDAVVQSLGPVQCADNAILIDVMLSYRAVGSHASTASFVESLPPLLAAQQMVREQYAFALNRVGRSEHAEGVLLELVAKHGEQPESSSILGRVYKDRIAAHPEAADTWRKRAIETYLRGFESDWRDAFPGINAITQMYQQDSKDPRIAELNPVVTYAVQRKIAAGRADYWDYVTLVELAVIGEDEAAARAALDYAIVAPLATEKWMFTTTAATLNNLTNAGAPAWTLDLQSTLRQAADKLGRR